MFRIRQTIEDMEPQKISQVTRIGINDPEVLALWFGETDLSTPDFIKQAGIAALADNQTFYTDRRGVPELRQGLSAYTKRIYDVDLDIERITVTGSGMTAIMIAAQCLVDQGDNVVLIAPIWPNIFYTVEVLGGESRFVRLEEREDGWRLDLDRLFDACDARTKAIFIASPSNPTGWVMSAQEQRDVLEFCRKRGIWIIADEVYSRLVYTPPYAPSFLHLAGDDDPVFITNSFSKNWAMTGWRLGWVVAPKRLGTTIGNLSGFNNTGATTFVQHAGTAALGEAGDAFVKFLVDYCARGRDIVHQRLNGMERVRMARPEAAFYAFFRIDGLNNSLEFAQRLVTEHKVGFAPGAAFGPDNDAYLRLCFAQSPEKLAGAMNRLDEGIRALLD